MSNKPVEKIGRRRFLKGARYLPALAVMGFAMTVAPTPASANCAAWNCENDCGLSVCKGTCSGGCEGTCTGHCDHACEDTCHVSVNAGNG